MVDFFMPVVTDAQLEEIAEKFKALSIKGFSARVLSIRIVI
jgi:hypothetical protein